ncbi:type III-A CRISPR-associated RAMP protein Csm3 [Methanopyrus sp.]
MVGVLGTIKVLGEIYLKTGTRIGTSEEELEIGGVDNPVIKDPVTGYPYVPGSSLKGRARALFELAWMSERSISPGEFFGEHHNERHECGFVRRDVYEKASEYLKSDPPWLDGNKTCPVCRLFGSAGDVVEFSRKKGNKHYGKYRESDEDTLKKLKDIVDVKKEARAIFRDAHPTKYTINYVFERAGEPTEIKSENAINRVSGEANPRSMERVPKGSRFGLEIVYRVEDETELRSDLRNLLFSLKLVEDHGIGHSTSRGYGSVEFRIAAICARSTSWYLEPKDGKEFPTEDDLDHDVSYLEDLKPERYEVVVSAKELEEDRAYLRPEEWIERLDEVIGELPWGR